MVSRIMNQEEALALVEKTFAADFDLQKFGAFISQLLKTANFSNAGEPLSGQIITDAFQCTIRSYQQITQFIDRDGKKLDVLIVNLKKDSTLERARASLRNFAADYLQSDRGVNKAAVLIAYAVTNEKGVYAQNTEWRFSYVTLEKSLAQQQSGIDKERITRYIPARCYSFFAGKIEASYTAKKQFYKLLKSQSAPTLSQIEEAFSVEKITNDFFNVYEKLFYRLEKVIGHLRGTHTTLKAHFKEACIDDAGFAKKLLSQIVFLYFLQRKGWLGVPPNDNYGEGDKRYLRNLFNYYHEIAQNDSSDALKSKNFFNDILDPLFYDALSSKRPYDVFDLFKAKPPCLNGGLFEPKYDYRNVRIELPDEIFSNRHLVKNDEDAIGILDIFDRYNFTIHEAERLEKEVAIDPQMLGHVFENLLVKGERGQSGTFYTPQIIVNYMCRQSLLEYLATHLLEDEAPQMSEPDKLTKANLQEFIALAELSAEYEIRHQEGKKSKGCEELNFPPSIRANAQAIDAKLRDIKVCDPASGSGAFPVGFLQEIVRLRLSLVPLLEETIQRDKHKSERQRTKAVDEIRATHTSYALKLHDIENSIYGVDKEQSAVDIARLRLWLSLIIEEEDWSEAKSLPNLDYKIVQGNSLLNEFRGLELMPPDFVVKHSTNSLLPNKDHKAQWQKEKLKQLYATRQKIFQSKDKHEKDSLAREAERIILQFINKHLSEENNRLKGSIVEVEKELKEEKTSLSRVRKEGKITPQVKSLSTCLADLQERLTRRKEDQRALKNLWQKRASKTSASLDLTDIADDNFTTLKPKDFTLWEFQFVEMFFDADGNARKNSGFDIVIANPPYIRQEKIKEYKAALERRFMCYAGTADILVYFYEQAINILRQRGTLTFITSNKYFRANYGEGLREFLGANTRIKQVIDFGDAPIFEAAAYASIILLQKETRGDNQIRVWAFPQKEKVEDFEEGFQRCGFLLPQRELCASGWRLECAAVLRLFEKLKSRGIGLGEYVEGKFYYGLKTGFNEAFVVNRKTRDRLIAQDASSAQILKPYLRGRDVKRWKSDFQDTWIIYVPWHFPLPVEGSGKGASKIAEKILAENYSAIYKHLLSKKTELSARNFEETGSRYEWYALQRWGADYWQEFEKTKIIYPDIVQKPQFAWDTENFYLANTLYMIPTDEKWLLAILNSELSFWFYTQLSPKIRGGYVRYTAQYVSHIPIPGAEDWQKKIIERLVDYLLFLSQPQQNPLATDKFKADYLEAIINACVYELFLTDELHAADQHFFAPLKEENLPALAKHQGYELKVIGRLFERLSDSNHPVCKNLCLLENLASARLVEGRA